MPTAYLTNSTISTANKGSIVTKGLRTQVTTGNVFTFTFSHLADALIQSDLQ